ncbi:MAG: iron-containing alcohol dehydrogenase [Pseudomonadota bacterium]
MTLITYITRIHFADGILEEALRSELEINNKQRALVLVDKHRNAAYEEILQRLLGSISNRKNTSLFEVEDELPREAVAHQVADFYRQTNSDILLALGSNNVIDLAKLSRVSIAHEIALAPFTIAEGGSRRIGEKSLPDLYAVPNIHGFCSALSAHSKLVQDDGVHARLMCKRLVPTVTICDPTLTSGVDAEATAGAGVDAIARCLEAYLSPNYNPPADGIAFDGLRRAVEYLPAVLLSDKPEYRREMMAASLNSALALQKGLGTTQVIGDGLEEAFGRQVSLGNLRRILLPKVIAQQGNQNQQKLMALTTLFGAESPDVIKRSIENFLTELPMDNSFSRMGIERHKLSKAATIVSRAMEMAPGLETIESSSIEAMFLESL